jgi:hypothetical protein
MLYVFIGMRVYYFDGEYGAQTAVIENKEWAICKH